MINSQQVTLFTLLETFIQKADEVGVDLRSKMDFLQNIENVDILTENQETPIAKSWDSAKLYVTTLTMKDNKKHLKAFFKNTIIPFNNELRKIAKLNAAVFKGIVKKVPAKTDKLFQDSLKIWIENPADPNNVNAVVKNLDFKPFTDAFTEEVKIAIIDIYQIRYDIENDIRKIKTTYNNMLNTKHADVEASCIEEIRNTIKRVSPQSELYMSMIQRLEKLDNQIEVFNEIRQIWADLLIGVKTEPYGKRQLVKKAKNRIVETLSEIHPVKKASNLLGEINPVKKASNLLGEINPVKRAMNLKANVGRFVSGDKGKNPKK